MTGRTTRLAVPSGPLERATHGSTDDDRFVFGRRLRLGAVAYVVVTVPLCALAFGQATGVRPYTSAMVGVAAVSTVPGLVVAALALAHAPAADRVVWRLWTAGFALGCLAAVGMYTLSERGWERVERWGAPVGLTVVVLLVVSNTLILRRRSGERAVAIDTVDLAMATIAALVPVALLVAEPIVASAHPWFTISAAGWTATALYGVLVAVIVRSRVRPDDRSLATLATLYGVVALVSSAAQVVQGVHDFALPPGPFLALHALCTGFTVLFFVWMPRRSSAGLERFAPQDQVRGRSAITIAVIVACPVIALEAWWGRDRPWVAVVAGTAALALVVLSSVRHLLAHRETELLYRDVQRAADERGVLLAQVMSHADADRHRAAAHLHRQAVSLYAALSAFSRTVGHPSAGPSGVPASAAEQLRDDLRRQADELRRVADAVKPPRGRSTAAPTLAAPVRAGLEALYGDDPRPELRVDIDPELELDWTTEAVVLRILQEAMHNVWRHARAGTVVVTIRAHDAGLDASLTDDGVGFEPTVGGRGLDAMEAMATFIDGSLTVTSRPGAGTTVRVRTAVPTTPPTDERPHLRLV